MLDAALQRKTLANTKEVKYRSLRMTGASEAVEVVSQASLLLVQNL